MKNIIIPYVNVNSWGSLSCKKIILYDLIINEF